MLVRKPREGDPRNKLRPYALTEALLAMWVYPYPTKHLRYAANMIATRANRGIPSPLD